MIEGHDTLETKESLQQASKAALSQISGRAMIAGIAEPVEVLRDTWGVPHIYARNQRDLFFAQGFVQAQDRLWQMEVWRRQAEGRLAEIGGAQYAERDRIARLVRYRGDWDAEWAAYGPEAREIVESFVAGVNAYIESVRDNPPLEFRLAGTQPEPWTVQVPLSRMAGFIMTRNASIEVLRALLFRAVGEEETQRLLPTDPPRPLPSGDLTGIDEGLLQLLGSMTAPIKIAPAGEEGADPQAGAPSPTGADGSNNWTLAGTKTASGRPILANDPHRPISLPSLRYVVHLVCPPANGRRGWNVIGASEPSVPGVTTGHNEHLAWGITIVNTDQQDLFIEETHPENPNLYRSGEEWLEMEVSQERLSVRGEDNQRQLVLKHTRHGPVVYEDREAHRAIALCWVGREPGTAGYLGSLSVDQAADWPQFLEAASRWRVPSANLAYAGVDGHIGWIAAALTPIRNGWDGTLPVSGADPERQWSGFLDTSDLPQKFDPPEGYVATANHNILPPGYAKTISYDWSPPFRFQRIDEVLKGAQGLEAHDSTRLQQDAHSLPARRLLALLRPLADRFGDSRAAGELLLDWDHVLQRDSVAAALYKLWEADLVQRVLRPRLPESLWPYYASRAHTHVLVDLMERPDAKFGREPNAGRDTALLESLTAAASEARSLLGEDPSAWRWQDLHRARFSHMLSLNGRTDRAAAVNEALDLGHVGRPGDGQTPIATGLGFDQTTGASYSHVMDLADWDQSLALNAPGQSGQPGAKHYTDLLERWQEGNYFPLLYSRQAVEAAAEDKLLLEPLS